MRGLRRQRGFGLVSALFLLVVLAGAAVVMGNVVGVGRRTAVQVLEQARAFQAARAGIEWGVHQALDAGACPAPATFTLTEGGLVGFSVVVACTRSDHREPGAEVAVYRVTAVAERGAFGSPDYVRRRLQVTFSDDS